MISRRTLVRSAWAWIALALVLVGCAQPGAPRGSLPATLPATLEPISAPSSTPEPPPSPTPNPATRTPIPSRTPALKPTTTTPALPTPCPGDACVISFAFPFRRPIEPPGRDSVDGSYRFGNSQNGLRDVHHGVEFLNSHGTPVLAVAAGEVAYAGDDMQTKVGLYYNFYGNYVVLKHIIPGMPQPVYSLYAHLSNILVQAGDAVQAGEVIGEVGATGAATGSHLHFEVRYGENTYAGSRNPEIWLQPRNGEDGQPLGVLAGKIVDPDGKQVAIPNIVVQRQGSPSSPLQATFYIGAYEEMGLVGLEPWQESFALGDLPPGKYQVSFIYRGPQQMVVSVEAGKLTLVTFRVEY